MISNDHLLSKKVIIFYLSYLKIGDKFRNIKKYLNDNKITNNSLNSY